MSVLAMFPAGWDLEIPAGTLLIRADVVMNTRPGAGGYAALIEATDMQDIILLRGGEPETDTKRMVAVLANRLAREIRGNRALVLCRSAAMQKGLAEAFSPYPMIRILGHLPVAVGDATRHAAVMAERSLQRSMLPSKHPNSGVPHEERLQVARFEPRAEDQRHDKQDSGVVHAAIQQLIKTVSFGDLESKRVSDAAQGVLDAAEREREARLLAAVRKVTAHDIPKPTAVREKEI